MDLTLLRAFFQLIPMGDLPGNNLTNLIYTDQCIWIVLVDDKGECVSSNQRLRTGKAMLA